MKIIKILLFFTLIVTSFSTVSGQQLSNGPEKQHASYITGTVTDNLKGDTLTLLLNGPFFSYQIEASQEVHATQVLTAVADKNGEFKFKIASGNSPFHITLFTSSKRNKDGYLLGTGDITGYLMDPGDSVSIDFTKHIWQCSGKGADLFKAQYAVEQSDSGGHQLKSDTSGYLRTNITKWLWQKDSLLNAQLQLLAGYRSKLSSLSYGIVRADIIGTNRASVCASINPRLEVLKSTHSKYVNSDFSNVVKGLQNGFADIDPDDRSCLSPKYVYYLYLKLVLEIKYDQVLNNDENWDHNYFPAINKHYSGILRDKLLTWWLTHEASANDLQPKYVTNALSVMQTPSFIQMVKDLNKTYAKGAPAIDFAFKDAKGKTVHLADFKGKVVVLDIWFTGCHGCVMVAAGLPYVEKAFENRHDVAFISISIDKDRALWLQSIAKDHKGRSYTHYTTPTATYLYTAGTGQDNAFIKKYVPDDSYPQMLIIDKEGKIYSSTPSRPVNTEMQSALIKELNEALKIN